MTVGAELFFDLEDGGPLIRELSRGQVALVSVRGPGKVENEDSAGIFDHPEGILLAVADGMGGMKGGGKASRVALEALFDHVRRSLAEEQPLRHGLLDGIDAANRAVLDLRLGAGTTLVTLLIQEGFAQPLHAGDSVALHVGQRGRIKTTTMAHSPTGYKVEAGLIDEEEALLDESRHLVSNFLGWEGMHIEVGAAREVAQRDTLLLASDGLVDNMTFDEVVERMRRGPLPEAAQALRDLARGRMERPEGPLGKPDDLTFLLYRSSSGGLQGR